MNRTVFAFFLFLFCFLQIACCWAAETGRVPVSADLIWAQHRGGVSTVFHSEASNGRWNTPEQVVVLTSSRINTPSILRDNHRDLWAFWSVAKGNQSLLYVSRKSDSRWTKPQLVPTGMLFAGGACGVVDKHDRIWLFWVGNNGASDDDIFSSRWDGKTWSVPLRVNRGNNSPDIFPVAGLTRTGLPWVVWTGFTGSSYKSFFSVWSGTRWRKQQLFTEDNPLFNVSKQRFASKIKLPDLVTEHTFAYIDIHDNETRLHSFRLMFQR